MLALTQKRRITKPILNGGYNVSRAKELEQAVERLLIAKKVYRGEIAVKTGEIEVG